jgi:glycosyltransferase involved in cell wall biosynthesis
MTEDQSALTYAVVTPVRNDSENVTRLASCLIAQSRKPTRWLIVDNGSNDSTSTVAERLATEHAWVQTLLVEPTPASSRARPIVRAFQAGVQALHVKADIVVKVDADVSIEPEYFERLIRAFELDESLGIASGSCYEQQADGEWQQRFGTHGAVWGAIRAYRSECYAAVNPLEDGFGWDGIDVIKARVAGWGTSTLLDLPFRHHRPEGIRESSALSSWSKQGAATYYMRYRLSYLVLRALFKARREPAALGLVWGYLYAAVRREERCSDPGVIEYQRRHQRLRSIPRRRLEATGRAN